MDSKYLYSFQNLLFLQMFNMELKYPIKFQNLPDSLLGQVIVHGIFATTSTTFDRWPQNNFTSSTIGNNWIPCVYTASTFLSTETDIELEPVDIYEQVDKNHMYSMVIEINDQYQNSMELLRKIIQHELIHVYCILKYSYFGHSDQFQMLQEKFGIYTVDEKGNKIYHYFHTSGE